jgi:hypothetical protein
MFEYYIADEDQGFYPDSKSSHMFKARLRIIV